MQTSTFEPSLDSRSEKSLEAWLRVRAKAEGFDKVGVTAPGALERAAPRFRSFLEAGFHGDMTWLEARSDRRANPSLLWPEVRAIIMLGLNYGPSTNPMDALARRSRAAISVYAKGADYHDVLKGKLKSLARDLAERAGAEVKVFVDTAPVMEKPLAEAAGLGWQGKHTNLVARDFGSWLFLGAIFTTAALIGGHAEADRCGTCRRCLDICPTGAFPAPYRLDARRCISYLTIEHKGPIAPEFREAIANRVYGCDDCLAVCPWNKFAQAASELRLAPRDSADNPPLAELLRLDEAAFRERFAGSPIKRTGRDRFLRNVLIAAGNSGDATLLPPVLALLGDASALVRGMAVWAAARLLERDGAAIKNLYTRHGEGERDPHVRAEWRAALEA